jgi:hypothetical protein
MHGGEFSKAIGAKSHRLMPPVTDNNIISGYDNSEA